ncbi:PREDICTED: laccase-like [Eufriesea mexicana]|uniref:laccase-like n=1 Tax=Eufriesea mexicana TaxID=516756 RepID=UPI00083BD7AD|nr:PREDICTED: laccase-like [Eufriesea mexicana]
MYSVTVDCEGQQSNELTGYIPGVSGMTPINVTNCINDEIRKNPSLSNPLECARPCHVSDKPKTCYYHFVIERYQVNGQACSLCFPNVTNSICPNCQCIPGDGVNRMALTVNRMIPGPSIQACLNDSIVIDVTNKVLEDAVTIHWHGLFQHESPYYDGVPSVTQCPILTGTTFRYQYRVANPGTHFWHAHTGLHKMDGIFGSLIVRVPRKSDLNRRYFDTDLASHVLVINDWMNEEATERYPGRSTNGITGQLPDALLINGKGLIGANNTILTQAHPDIVVEPNTRHRFRLINSFCTVCPGQLTIEGHNLTVIESDGQPIRPFVVTSIVSFPGERYDFVINTNQRPGAYWIQLRALDNCDSNKTQQLGILQYLGASKKPTSPVPTYSGGLAPGVVLNPLDVSCNTQNPKAICINKLRNAIPIESGLTEPTTDVQFIIPIGFVVIPPDQLFRPNQYRSFLYPGGVDVAATLNGITYQQAPSPPISQPNDVPPSQFCDGDRSNCTDCTCSHMLRIPLNATVEIILVDTSQIPRLTHPFHMHGFAFRVLSMDQPLGPYSNTGNGSTIDVDFVKQLDSSGKIKRNFKSASKDTLAVPNNGYTVIRFRANNAGYWFFHCHFVYHQMAGMELILKVGEQSDLPPVPPNFPRCGNFKAPIKGLDDSDESSSEEETFSSELNLMSEVSTWISSQLSSETDLLNL